MLITGGEFDEYIDFAYELALDLTRSGYPTYTDRIKTKEDFLRIARKGLEKENDEILLYRRGGRVEGWIHYFHEPEDQYVQTCTFNIRSGTREAMEEFLGYLTEKFPGYHAYLGFPGENKEAVSCLYKKGFACNEDSFNNTMHFDIYRPLPQKGDVRRIGRENYGDFRFLHAPYDEEMYWNCDHILAALPKWHIYVCYRDQLPVGAIYYSDNGPMLEIFGTDYPGDVFDETVYRNLLTCALNEGKRSGAKYMTWFCDERHQPLALELGFCCVGRYLCFDKVL